ncbi:MAG TPA: glycine cleavage T C-terminal barrel domain-containing protein [Gemmatimonadales bacterium]|nr:glycine cleavage T C-terminal barrel domain-containing protein [Gemmatimonadales bacterium]
MTQPFDMALVQRGARLRRSPFFEATQRHGAKAYTVYNHMLFPICFADLEEEFWHLVNHVTLWDVSVERQVEITGPDALTFTNMLTPRDLTRCAVGQGKYVVITGEDGGIINDPVLLRLAENHFWLALADSDVLLWARGVALKSGLNVRITEPDVSPLQIQGPKAKPLIADLLGERASGLAYYHFLETKLDGIPVVLTRTGWTGEVGYEIYLRDGARGDALWERVMTAGKPYHLKPTGPSDIRRIEAGILNWGADITLDTNVYQVGLERLVDERKTADYIGREALARIKAQGVSHKLAGVEISGPPIAFNPTKWPVQAGGRTVGHITSAIYTPRLKKNIGYALVPVASAALGTPLTVTLPDGERSATVVPRPFLDPEKSIPKA